MPEAKWLHACNPYSGWTLYRLWKPPKPLKIETPADVMRRLLAHKPAAYSWTLYHQHKAAPVKEGARDAA